MSSSPPVESPVIETVASYSDANPGGDIFGGYILAQMDLAGGARAYAYVGSRVVTAGASEIDFAKPIFVGDRLRFYADLIGVGRTSLTMNIHVWRRSAANPAFEKVASGVYTFVAVDQMNRPLPISHISGKIAA